MIRYRTPYPHVQYLASVRTEYGADTLPRFGTVRYGTIPYRTIRYLTVPNRDVDRDNPVKSQDGDIPGYPRDIEKRQDITIMVLFTIRVLYGFLLFSLKF